MSETNFMYPYITADNRTNRQSYMYSPYHGMAFLQEYLMIRQKTMHNLAASCSENEIPITESEVIALLEQLAQSSPSPFVQNSSILMNSERLERFIHSFEIHKRVFGEYDSEGRPADRADYLSTTPYIVLATVLGVVIAKYHRLKYLNSLIKLSDTISSFVNELTVIELRLFMFVLQVETLAVRKLMEQKGI